MKDVQRLNREFESKDAKEVLAWAFDAYGHDIVVSTSFGLEGAVLIDLAHETGKPFRVMTLDTGRLHEETYELMDKVRGKYKLKLEVYFPNREKVEELVRTKGLHSFRESIENRKECCGIRKVEPLKRALAGEKAWVTGLTREQSVTRKDIELFEIDEAHGGILKINPLVSWSDQKILDYVKDNKLPYNKLHDLGFASIGCAPCTRAVKPGEDVRAGRWWWENPEHKECGIHGRKG